MLMQLQVNVRARNANLAQLAAMSVPGFTISDMHPPRQSAPGVFVLIGDGEPRTLSYVRALKADLSVSDTGADDENDTVVITIEEGTQANS